ncbi:MAG TPA: hypothetical protein VJ439_01705, partial [Candidatus Bathyarchaeia archaeon]|nr:hypothetical protein [Candidatus Bathyarchaeia archaeon]
MKKATVIGTVPLFVMILLVSISFNVMTVRADDGYTIEQVNHKIDVLYNGYILINDTITLNITGQTGPSSFLMGFPDKYGSQVVRCVAHSETETYTVTLDVPLENRLGFYGVKIDFPQGAPQTYSVEFVLSNNLLSQDSQDASQYTLDFPQYPALTKAVGRCNGSINLPTIATYLGGSVNGSTYVKENLAEFAHFPADVTFLLPDNLIQIADVVQLKREISVNEFGEVVGADTYEIVNRAQKKLSYFEVFIPMNASDPRAEDQFGRPKNMISTDSNTNRYLVNFTLEIGKDQLTRFTIRYRLHSSHLTSRGTNTLGLNLLLFQNENYYISQVAVTFMLPEGAKVLDLENNLAGDVFSIGRNIFSETVTVSKSSVIASDSLGVGIVYAYNPLWISFRPALWLWVFSIVGCVAVIVAWKKPKGPGRVSASAATMRLGPETLKAFVDAYEEKQKIALESESLEARVEKGKIPRRRYKVRMKTLEIRLNALSRNLTEYKEKLRAAGG